MNSQKNYNKSIVLNKEDEKHWSDKIIEIADNTPDKELENLPRDLAENLEHYMYGSPKN